MPELLIDVEGSVSATRFIFDVDFDKCEPARALTPKQEEEVKRIVREMLIAS